MDENKKRISTIGGVLFIGCMFIGFGLGFYFNPSTLISSFVDGSGGVEEIVPSSLT